VYAYPNIVLPFVCGLIVDHYIGIRWGAMLFVSLSTLGEFIFCVGIHTRTYWLALLGRFVCGLGGESLSVMQGIFMIKWFEGPRLALVFGLVTIPLRLGSSASQLKRGTHTWLLSSPVQLLICLCAAGGVLVS
jgi:MFS family permease